MRSPRARQGLGSLAALAALAVLGVPVALAAACGDSFGAAEPETDAAVESGIEGGGVDGATEDATSDARDADGGPAVVDAGPPCPYEGGCPCIQPSCNPTVLGTYNLPDVVSTTNDAQYLYLGAGLDGLLSIAFTSGGLTTIYKPAVATNKVETIVLAKSDFVLIEETGLNYPDIIAVSRASPHTGRVIVPQAHFDGTNESRALAANDTRIYWNETLPSTVKSALYDGGDVRSVGAVADGLLATTDWLYATNAHVTRYSTDLATPEAVAGPRQSRSLAVAGTSVLWTGHFDDSVYRAPVAFTDDAGVAISSVALIIAMRLGDDGFLYFQNSTSIFRCRLPDCQGGPAQLVASPSGTLTAVVGGTAYVVDSSVGGEFVVSRIALHD